MLALVSTLWLSVGPVVAISSESTCPTAEDVAARVSALLPARESSEAPDLARIFERDGALVLTLARADGTPIGERALDRGYPCADLAAAAAVLVAAWESDVHPEFRLAPAAPAPEPPPPAEPPAVAPPPPPPVVSRPAAPPLRVTSAVDLGAALTGSLAPSASGAGPALGALATATWLRPGGRAGLRTALAATAERDLPLAAGTVRWRRVSAALGPDLRVRPPRGALAIDLHADVLAAWVTASGSGFASDRDASALDAGLGAGLRVAWLGAGALFPWVEVAGAAWLRSPTAYAAPGSASVVLPRSEALAAVGLGFRAGR